MRVVIEQRRPWGPYVDVYLIEESQFSNRLLVFKGPDPETGAHVMESVPLDEGIESPTPSFSLDARWIQPLVDALTQHAPQTADAALLKHLDKETERVDKMLDHMIQATSPGVLRSLFGTERA